MRAFLLVVVVACVAATAVAAASVERSEDNDFAAFMQFVNKYNKTYASMHEFQARFRIFQTSLDRVDQHLAAGTGRPGEAVFGVTPFSDLTPQEFKAQYLGSVPPRRMPDASINVRHPISQLIPTVVDWRTKGAVTPVKNQEQCGSCWAFSATEEIESMTFMNSGKLMTLSPQQIVSCDMVDSGCGGGWPYLAYQYVEQAGGITTDAAYPYTSGGGVTGTCSLGTDPLVAKVLNYTYATPPCTDSCTNQNENLLMSNLAQYGPVSICVDAMPWQDYGSGVLMASSCSSDYSDLDHCVQLVGFDRTQSIPFHSVRNSWGTSWGIQGYINLEMGQNTCGLADSATFVDAVPA